MRSKTLVRMSSVPCPFDVVGSAPCSPPGVPPGSGLTFFASPKKVSKERRPDFRALRVPEIGAGAAGKKELALLGCAQRSSDNFFSDPPPRPQSRRSIRALCQGHPRSPAGREVCARPAWRCAASCVALHPLAAARSAPARGLPAAGRSNKVVRAPLARRAKRASFLCSPSGREHRSEPGTPGAGVGSPFFAYFLWRSKESEPAAGRDPRRAATTRTRREEGKE